ncbi:hypothetical protein [Halosimplex sp. J119]
MKEVAGLEKDTRTVAKMKVEEQITIPKIVVENLGNADVLE